MSDWFQQAACRGLDPDLFFPLRGQNSTQAKEVCVGCPVRQRCLDYCLSLPRHQQQPIAGVWGGTNEKERRGLRRTRRTADRVVELADARGLTATQIAHELDISVSVAARYLKAAG